MPFDPAQRIRTQGLIRSGFPFRQQARLAKPRFAHDHRGAPQSRLHGNAELQE